MKATEPPISEVLNLIAAVHAMIGYCESLKPGTVITEDYMRRMKDYYVANLEATISGVRDHPIQNTVSDDVVERVAKALFERMPPQHGADGAFMAWEEASDQRKERYLSDAKAAIAAMGDGRGDSSDRVVDQAGRSPGSGLINRVPEDAGSNPANLAPTSDSLGSRVKYSDGAYSREYEEQQVRPSGYMGIAETHGSWKWIPPTLQTIGRWKQHEAISRRDWVSVLTMLEGFMAEQKREISVVDDVAFATAEEQCLDGAMFGARADDEYRMMPTGKLRAFLTAYESAKAIKPVLVDIESAARALAQHEHKFGTGMDSPEESWASWHSVYESMAEACAEAWGLKWK